MNLRQLSRSFSQLSPNKELYEVLRKSFYSLYEKTPCMPLMVRLGWHDAGTYSKTDGTGGPNGSILFPEEQGHGANAGITFAVEKIHEMKKAHGEVGLADLIQAGSYLAVSFTKGPEMNFRFGRKDAQSSKECTPDGRLPDASQGVDHLREVFGTMGLNDLDIVALSGAHTLGRARKERSGWDGKWTLNELVFDNSYFVELIEHQHKELLRLPTDEALLKEPEFFKWVQVFAKDQNKFFEEYTKSYQKLSELGFN